MSIRSILARTMTGSCSVLLRRLLLMTAVPTLAACAPTPPGMTSHDVVFDHLQFRVVAIDLATADLGLHWRNPATGKAFASIHALQQWGAEQGRRLLFATNAGIYDARGEPLGMYVENGRVLKPLNTAHGDPRAGNFSLQPNGVFAIDAHGRASVQTTANFAASHGQPRTATQSGPMLVIDGQINPQFTPESDSTRWRNGVCARTPHEAVFAVSTSPVNFYTFAALFRDKLHCRNALYLDGTLTQIYVGGMYYGAPAFMVKPYAGIFAVFAPASSQ